MPKVLESPGVVQLQQGGYGTIGAGAPNFDRSFTQFGKAAEYGSDAFRVMQATRDKAKKDEEDANVRMAIDAYYLRLHSYMVSDDGPLNERGTQVMGKKNGMGYQARNATKMSELANAVAMDYGMNASEDIRRKFDEGVLGIDKTAIPTLIDHEADERWKVVDQSYTDTRNRLIDTVKRTGGANGGAIFDQIKRTYIEQGRHSGLDVDSKAGRYAVTTQTRSDFTDAVKAYGASMILADTPENFHMFLYQDGLKGRLDPNEIEGMKSLAAAALQVKGTRRESDQVAQEVADSHSDSSLMRQAAFNGGFDSVFTNELSEQAKLAQGWQGDKDREQVYQQDAVGQLMVDMGGAPGAIAVIGVYQAQGGTVAQAKEVVQRAMAEQAAANGGNPNGFEKRLSPSAQARRTVIARRFAEGKNKAAQGYSLPEIYSVVQKRNPGAPPEEVMAASVQALNKINTMVAMREVGQQAILQTGLDMFNQGNYDLGSIPRFAMLTPENRAFLTTVAMRSQMGLDQRASDTSVFTDLLLNPARLASMSDLEFMKTQADLSQEQYAILSRRRDQARQKKADLSGDVNIDEVSRQIKNYFLSKGADLNDKAVKAQIASMAVLTEGILRRELLANPGTKEQHGQSWYQDRVYTILETSVGTIDGEHGQAFQLKPDDINEDVELALERAYGFKDGSLKGLPDLVRLYVQSLYDPTFEPGLGAVPMPDRERIRNAYKLATGGKSPSEATVFNTYLQWKQDDIEWMSQMYGANWRSAFSDNAPIYERPTTGRYSRNPSPTLFSVNDSFQDR